MKTYKNESVVRKHKYIIAVGTSSAIMFLFFILISNFVSAGYFGSMTPDYYYNIEHTKNTGNDGYNSGYWNSQIQSLTYHSFSPDNSNVPAYIFDLDMGDGSINSYTIKRTTTGISILRFNHTINYFQSVAYISSSLANIGMFETASGKAPDITLKRSDTAPTASIDIINPLDDGYEIYTFYNNMTLSLKCRYSDTYSREKILYDADNDLLVGLYTPNNQIVIANTFRDCTKIGTGNFLSLGQASGGFWNFGIGDMVPNFKTIVFANPRALGASSLSFIDYLPNGTFNLTENSPKRVRTVTGYYQCVNYVNYGVECTKFSDGGIISKPVFADVNYDGFDEVILAVKDMEGVVIKRDYNIFVINGYAELVYDYASNNYLFSDAFRGCGDVYNIVNFTTFYQPAISNSYLGGKTICSACEQEKTSYLRIGCFNAYSGELIKNVIINSTMNHYYHALYSLGTIPGKPLNNIIFGDYDVNSAGDEMIIGNMLFDNNLELKYALDYDNKVYINTFGDLTGHDYFIESANWLVFSTNNSIQRIYGNDYVNKQPYWASGKNTINPDFRTKAICLNFTRDSGIMFYHEWTDADNTDGFYKYECDKYNLGNNPVYSNWTNYTGSSELKFWNTCKYNTTGIKYYKAYVTDYLNPESLDLLNRPLSDEFTINVIDGSEPNCIGSYASAPVITNEPIIPVLNDSQILAQYNISANQTIEGGIEQTLISYGIVTQTSKMILWFLVMFFTAIAMMMFAFKYGLQGAGFYSVITLIEVLMFLIGTALGLIPVWLTIIIIICVAVIGSAGIIGKLNGGGGAVNG
jgi:hypothetical protein